MASTRYFFNNVANKVLFRSREFSIQGSKKSQDLSFYLKKHLNYFQNVHQNHLKHPLQKKEQGFTLIEVLVTLIILATGLLGVVSMQVQAKKSSFDAMQRSIASSLAQNIIERIKDTGYATIVNYTSNSPYGSGMSAIIVSCNTEKSPCNAQQMAKYHTYHWEQALIGANVRNEGVNVGGLINAVGCIEQHGHNVMVTISWRGKDKMTAANKTNHCGDDSPFRRQVLVASFIS